jgi:hypothetical protein
MNIRVFQIAVNNVREIIKTAGDQRIITAYPGLSSHPMPALSSSSALINDLALQEHPEGGQHLPNPYFLNRISADREARIFRGDQRAEGENLVAFRW